MLKQKTVPLTKLARVILDQLKKEQLVVVKTTEKAVLNKIEHILLADAQIEADIEAQARRMMDKFRPQIEAGEIDYQKMFVMLKKQLIKDKKFIP